MTSFIDPTLKFPSITFPSMKFPSMPALSGVRMAVGEASIQYRDRSDLLFLIFDHPVTVAGVFTCSRCPSAPVDHCRSILSHGKARALIVNSGNANAFTGKKGVATTELISTTASRLLQCPVDEIYLASTGVIGEPLDATNLCLFLAPLADQATENNWLAAAQAIMTTDSFPKGATRTIRLQNGEVTLNGIAKGAGMIAPDMATMLAFLVTDAPIDKTLLQQIIVEATQASFNSIRVDGDTSTSDTVLFFATGNARSKGVLPLDDPDHPDFKLFSQTVHEIFLDLALQIVCDGEGANSLIEIDVTGAISDESAKKIAISIADSPLVKTAIAGKDANWGRVIMAIGKAGQEADRDRIAIWFGPHRLAANGERDPEYSEQVVANYMKNNHIHIYVDMGLGQGHARIWTCDLTAKYIEINSNYRS